MTCLHIGKKKKKLIFIKQNDKEVAPKAVLAHLILGSFQLKHIEANKL